MSDKCTKPSISSDSPTNNPTVIFLISPSIVSPILFSDLYFSGLSMHCLIPSDILLFEHQFLKP